MMEGWYMCRMRRPVLPSSGQAYDEINIVRHADTAKDAKCPVSGKALKTRKAKGTGKRILQRTPDYHLRTLIRDQATNANVRAWPVPKWVWCV